jgi:hypothetical protein
MNPRIEQPTRMARAKQRVLEFFTAPASPRPLATLRIGIAAVLLLQALSIAGSIHELFGDRAIVQWSTLRGDAAGMGYHPLVPRVSDAAELLAPLEVSPAACVRGLYLTYVFALGCLLIGWRSRISAGFAWLSHLMLCASGYMTIYGVDQFANIALFYCLWMPVGAALSCDISAGRASDAPSIPARIGLRVLQVHLCLVYLTSGIEKAKFSQWWNGDAIWRSVNLPEMAQFDMTWLAYVPWLAVLLGWGTLAIELGYAFLIWPRRTRKWTVLATLSLHAGVAVTLGLYSFSAVMCALTVAAFLVSTDPLPATITERVAMRNPALSAGTR